MLHPHLIQKLELLYTYFSTPSADFGMVFSNLDFFDLLMHLFLLIVLFVFGIRKQMKKVKTKKQKKTVFIHQNYFI